MFFLRKKDKWFNKNKYALTKPHIVTSYEDLGNHLISFNYVIPISLCLS